MHQTLSEKVTKKGGSRAGCEAKESPQDGFRETTGVAKKEAFEGQKQNDNAETSQTLEKKKRGKGESHKKKQKNEVISRPVRRPQTKNRRKEKKFFQKKREAKRQKKRKKGKKRRGDQNVEMG